MPALSVCERANYQSPHWQPIRANPAIKVHTHHDERFAVKTARDDDCLSGPSCYEAHHPAGLASPGVQRKKLSSWLSPQLVSLQMMLVALHISFALARKMIQWKLLWLILVLDQLYTTSIISTAGWERISGGAFPRTQQLRPPTRGCPSSLRGSSAHAHFNITVLPNKKRCLDHPLEHAHYPSLSSWYELFGSSRPIMRTMHIESWDLPYLAEMKHAKPDLWGMHTVSNPSFHWGWDDQL